MHDDKLSTADAGVSSGTGPVQGRSVNAQALAAGYVLEKLEIVDLVGAGRSGFVYLAYDRGLRSHVALREYLPTSIAVREAGGAARLRTPEDAAVFNAGLRSFASEALVLARIDSPSLVKVLRYWEGNGTGYAVMPFYEGGTLKHAVAERRVTVNEVWIRTLLGHLLDAVEAVHRAQSCHGNISPADILVRTDGRPLLLEFDAAKTIIAELTQTQAAILKPGFSPIEQYPEVGGMQQGTWSDVYSLGAVAYYLIAGKAPPPALQRIVNDGMRPAREAGRGSYSDTLLETVDRALAVRPEHRPQSAAELRQLLGANNGRNAFSHRDANAREAIRADREAAAAQASAAAVAAAASAAAHTATAPSGSASQARSNAAASGIDRQPPAHHLDQPLQGEWRKPIMADHRAYPPRRRRAAPLVLMSGAVLLAGIAAGVMYSYSDGSLPWEQTAQTMPPTKTLPGEVVAGGPAAEQGSGTSEGERPGTIPEQAPVQEAEPAPTATASAPPQAQETPAAAPPPESPPVAKANPAPTPPAPVMETAPGTPQTAEPAKSKEKEQQRLTAAERDQWRIASNLDEAAAYEAYLDRYPKGQYAATARAKLAALRSRPAPAAATPPLASAPAATRDKAYEAPASTPAETPATREPAPADNTASTARSAQPTETAAAPRPSAPATTPSVPAQASISQPDSAGASGPGPQRAIRVEGQTVSGDISADPETGALSGTGRVAWANGDRYEGTLVKGYKEGKGMFIWNNGQRYSGDWVRNEPHGKGSITYANGNRYDGEVRHGLPNGRGVLAFANGNRYDGDIRNGLPHGKGVMVFADGTRYEGDVRDGQPNGQGVTRFRNGDVYVGAVVKGRSHGKGRFSWANGTVWEGEFRDGQRTENGQLLAQGGGTPSSGASASASGAAGQLK